MLTKIYYLSLVDYEYSPFAKSDYITILKQLLDDSDLSQHIVPNDISTNSSIYNELFNLVCSRYRNLAVAKIVKHDEEMPNNEEIENAFINWQHRYLALLNETYEYYITLLTQYANAKADLLADITAISTNKVKFNDTPQNPNTSDVYEGDNYITNFTKTEGSTSSPLMSRIMRLKEIQDNYRDLMSEWVNDFRRIFYEVFVEY